MTRSLATFVPARLTAAMLAAPLAFVLMSGCSDRTESTAEADARHGSLATAPDNTGVNARDRNDRAPTAENQSENEADRNLTARIRQEIVKDDSLSTTAKNVKIITANGVVTLRGPVKSADEKAKVAAKAQQVAGVQRVDDQLGVAAQ